MRVLFVVDGLAGGGAEKNVLRLAGHMAGTGHAVTVASLRDEQAYPTPAGVEVIVAADTPGRPFRKLGEYRRRARILDEHLAGRVPFDLVVTTLYPADRITALSSAGDEAWHRLVAPPSAIHLRGQRGFKRLRRKRRVRAAYAGRRVVAISEGVRRDLTDELGIHPSDAVTIYNPFDAERIRTLAAEPCPLEGTDYIVYVGRFARQKRLDRLLGALGRSSYEGNLVLAGTGPPGKRAELERLIGEGGMVGRVVQVGFQANPYPFIKHARALVLSSDFEGFGNVLVEALACGTPPVSTRCPSGPDEILTGELSIGLADLTEESLAAAIDRVLADPPAITEASYERFSIARISEQYLALADR